MTTKADDVIVYSNGLVYCSVCSSLDTQETVDAVNRLYPSGVNSPWIKSCEDFKDGARNPSPCPDNPDRKHYLLNC